VTISKWHKGLIRSMSLASYSLFSNRNIYKIKIRDWTSQSHERAFVKEINCVAVN
jgi:hypothetical protein